MKPSAADADTPYQRGTLLSVECTFSSGEGALCGRRMTQNRAAGRQGRQLVQLTVVVGLARD
jgi:hypothetical protein